MERHSTSRAFGDPFPAGRRAIVLGLGLTGWSAARWLRAHGADVVVADTRVAPPFEEQLARELPDVPVRKGAFGDEHFSGRDLLVLSPGLSKDQPVIARAVAAGAELVGDIELFARAVPSRTRVVGITGSNGKSTVTALTGELARAGGLDAKVAGNIGTPVLDVLAQAERTGRAPDLCVLELSSYQLETTSSLRLAAAAVLNVTENHLDRYPDVRTYAAAKARIFAHAAVQIVNRDDAGVQAMPSAAARIVTFGASAPATTDQWGLVNDAGRTWLARYAAGTVHRLVESSDLRLVGLHNALNALAALALVEAVGLQIAPLLPALRSFAGLPHRMSRIAERGGVAFIDDSKATTVAAAIAALEGLGRKAVLIAGGDGKGQDFSPLAVAVGRHCRAVVLIGRDAPRVHAALRGSPVHCERTATLEQAVAVAAGLAQAGDAVLLSPACASLDMFRDFAHRGEVFRAAVQALDGEPIDA